MGKTKRNRRAKKAITEEAPENPISHREALISSMKSFGFDGDFFVRNLEQSCERRARRGQGPRRTRWLHYCSWAVALMDKEVGPEDAEYAYPEEVLNFIRAIVPGDVKGESKEDAFKVTLQDFCSALDIPVLPEQ